jgi:DNA-binding transcriptional regulator/RsmH inhibitor MraZ
VDAQGRILLPKHHVDYAKLRGEVIVTGAGDHLQVCDPDEARTEKVPVNLDKMDPAQISEIFNGAMPQS